MHIASRGERVTTIVFDNIARKVNQQAESEVYPTQSKASMLVQGSRCYRSVTTRISPSFYLSIRRRTLPAIH